MRPSIAGHLRSSAVSYAALFIALGGTAYAAVALPANSVGTGELQDSAVTSAKVHDGSLRAVDFQAGELSRGLKVTVRKSVDIKVASGATQTVAATCLPGERATGGGNTAGGDAASSMMVVTSQPAFKGNPAQPGQLANGWIVTVRNVSNFGGAGVDGTIAARVVCVSR